jgi:hypothetical protein
MRNIPEPSVRERAYYYDFLYADIGFPVKRKFDVPHNLRKLAGNPKQAYNLNCLDEVPDSSWYTNRNVKTSFTTAQIQRGPNRGSGPAPGTWTVIQGKAEGISPGFLIRDQKGEVYQLKFDPPQYPEMATAAEVIASKLYFAAGYNVKENYLVEFRRDRLLLDSDAKIKDRYGRLQTMAEQDLDRILAAVAQREDGSYRAVAGKFLDGAAKGPFSFEGRRHDDHNDWIPHEHRRDLRGLRIFASWVNDNDFREGNTLDVWVEEGGRRFLKHYFIDLGSTLGSETVFPNPDHVGNEYLTDRSEMAKSLFSLGLYRRPWKGNSKRVTHPSVGLLEGETFEPARWKPNYTVVPFQNMTLQDAFWGTQLVLSFTDEQIRAAVEAGEFSDHGATEELVGILIRRRDKIGRYWLQRVNPPRGFRVSTERNAGPALTFEDVEVGHGFLAAPERSYAYAIRDAQTGRLIQRGSAVGASVSLVSLPRTETTSTGRVYRVSISSLRQGKRQGGEVDVYVASGAQGFSIVGVDRKE